MSWNMVAVILCHESRNKYKRLLSLGPQIAHNAPIYILSAQSRCRLHSRSRWVSPKVFRPLRRKFKADRPRVIVLRSVVHDQLVLDKVEASECRRKNCRRHKTARTEASTPRHSRKSTIQNYGHLVWALIGNPYIPIPLYHIHAIYRRRAQTSGSTKQGRRG